MDGRFEVWVGSVCKIFVELNLEELKIVVFGKIEEEGIQVSRRDKRIMNALYLIM